MTRPCEETIKTDAGDITPDNIDYMASNTVPFCNLILKLTDIEEAKKVAVAIKDNWSRFFDSC